MFGSNRPFPAFELAEVGLAEVRLRGHRSQADPRRVSRRPKSLTQLAHAPHHLQTLANGELVPTTRVAITLHGETNRIEEQREMA